jgi:hypothetical protein
VCRVHQRAPARSAEGTHVVLIGALVLSGVVVDLVGRAMRPGPDRPVQEVRLRGLVPLVTRG